MRKGYDSFFCAVFCPPRATRDCTRLRRQATTPRRAPIAVSSVNSVRKIYVLREKNTFLAKNFVSLFAFFEAVAEKFTDKEIT